MSVLKIRNTATGNWDSIKSIKGPKGDTGDLSIDQLEALSQDVAGAFGSLPTATKEILSDIVAFLKAVPFDDEKADAEDLDEIQAKINSIDVTPYLVSISAVANTTVYDEGTPAADLDITVKALYSDGSEETVTDYEISGTVAAGTNTFTVSYLGKSATITVTGVALLGLVIPKNAMTTLPTGVSKSRAPKFSALISVPTYDGTKDVTLYGVGLKFVGFNSSGMRVAKLNTTSGDSANMITNKPNLTDIVGQGKVLVTCDLSSVSFDNSTVSFVNERYGLGAEMILYKFSLYSSSDELIAEFVPTENIGTMENTVSGSTATFSDVTGMTLVGG